MYRNGAFTDLVWEEVGSCHKQQWDAIYNHFGFSGEDAKIVHLMEGKSKLDALAENCVSLCRELLFSLKPLETIKNGEPWYEGNEDFSWCTRNLMENSLTQAICDHLIVTFAYRFFCENLKPEKLKKYSDVLFDLREKTLGFPINEAKIITTGRRADAYKTLKRKFESFCNEVGVPPQDATGVIHEGTMLNVLDNVSDKDAAEKFKSQLRRELNKENLPPPSVWFLAFFVSERIRFRNVFKNTSKNEYVSLMEFISEADWTTSLLPMQEYIESLQEDKESKDEDKKTKEEDKDIQKENKNPAQKEELLPHKMFSMHDDKSVYVGIPIDVGSNSPAKVVKQVCRMKKEDIQVEISSRLQMVFNNYLFERNFHLLSSATMEDVLHRLEGKGLNKRKYIDSILSTSKVNAPFAQSMFIVFMGSNSEVLNKSETIERYVNRWNRYALPVLEDLFIWSVKETFQKADEVVAAINEWIKPNSTYKRLLPIRLVKGKQYIPKDGDIRLYNEIVDRMFSTEKV